MANYDYYELTIHGEFYDKMHFIKFIMELQDDYWKNGVMMYVTDFLFLGKLDVYAYPADHTYIEISFKYVVPEDFNTLLDQYCEDNDLKIEGTFFSDYHSNKVERIKFPEKEAKDDTTR